MTEFMAGLIGGLCGAVVSHPLDSIRVISQKNIKCTTLQCLKKLNQTGITAGLMPALTTQAGIYALLFGIYESAQNMITSDERERTIWTSAMAGCVTGLIIAPITCPLEVMKCRQQVGKSTPISMMFRGVYAISWRCGLGNASFFACIHMLGGGKKQRETAASSDGKNKGRFDVQDAWIGGVSGIAYWLVAAPFDLIKTRQQTQLSNESPLSLLSAAREAMIESGGRNANISVLWRGFGLAVARTVPMQAAVMLSYTACLRSWLVSSEDCVAQL
jgi:solute carrier family 25 (mitochondrial carnitine/acylcarnitine transporter), member 20/29